MLLYRKQERIAGTRGQLDEIYALAGRIKTDHHESARDLLMAFGEFESGVLDSLMPERDSFDERTMLMRECALTTGHLLFASWEGRRDDLLRYRESFLKRIEKVYRAGLPEKIVMRASEGYAYYGIYPECYMEAAKKFWFDKRPEKAVCLGLRSIGASLSAAVSAVLEGLGTEVISFAVRPRGEPFQREFRIGERLERTLLSGAGSYFLIVDEGPGLSGSTMCSVAAGLSGLGAADGKIVFFPSWKTDGKNFLSQRARTVWQRHPKYCEFFEDTWLKSGKLQRSFPSSGLADISTGNWRRLFYGREDLYPAAHPLHERRKYICADGINSADVLRVDKDRLGPVFFIKFEGLGRYGKPVMQKAEMLAEAGFSPAPRGMTNGFAIYEFLNGKPLAPGKPGKALLDRICEYLLFTEMKFEAGGRPSFDDIIAMMAENIRESLGPEWKGAEEKYEFFRGLYEEGRPVRVDGRMIPHEWLLTGRGYMKTDSLDHHSDQFFPRCQDIAWDLAGAVVEFGMDEECKQYLLERYSRLSGDGSVQARFPFYMAFYLSFRAGYARLSSDELGPVAEGRRFLLLAGRYKSLLGAEIRKSGFPGARRPVAS